MKCSSCSVQGLKITVEGLFEGLGNTGARGKTDLRQTVSYAIDTFTVGLKAKELIWGYDLKELQGVDETRNPWMQFKPFVHIGSWII